MATIILPTFQEMVDLKTLTLDERKHEIDMLKKFDGLTSGIKLAGNKYLQHYFFKEIAKVKFDNKPSLFEIMHNEELKQKLYKNTITKNTNLAMNMTQAYTRMSPVCMFKPTIAKFLYKKFQATAILDPTAGWGGRMLGAVSSGIKYTGIDTNTTLKSGYDEIMSDIKGDTKMIWKSCLDVDFSTIEYDMVLTSPPYINKEMYENMKPFESGKAYYVDFLIPIINKGLANIKNNGAVCININKEYYDGLLKNGFRKADEIVEFQQSTRQNKEGITKMESVYCWRNDYKESIVINKPQEITPSSGAECKDGKCQDCFRKDEEIRILRNKIEQLKLLI